MSSLEIINHSITEDIEYLGQLEPFKSEGLPTNTIIFKTLPGLGATHLEICYKGRNSIIIEPNIPVIKGKHAKHLNILAVYSGITQKNVKEYLNNSIYPKKIITTPEGYIDKVKPVIIKHLKFDLLNDFFLLLDECDRLITDVNYRGRIIAPMKDFFEFKGKAMVSATAILPSDPRFAQFGFKIIRINPTYDYKKDLTLVNTNNIVGALRATIEDCNDKPIFIFLNSTLSIYSIIKLLNIKEKSKVFCAEDSIGVLNKLDFKNTSTELGGYASYNFLTSRFFSAVDIDLDYKPDVIMVTDVYTANHSILDPSTDIIQISGRFRKKEGSKDRVTTSSLTHITNYKPNILFKSDIEAEGYIKSSYSAYNIMFKQAQNSLEEGARATFTQGHENTEISEFINDDHELEPNMFDNYIRQQNIRSYYRGHKFLKEAYDKSNYFNVKSKTLMLSVDDADNMKLALAKTKIQVIKAVAKLLKAYSAPTIPENGIVFKFYDPQTEINKLRDKYPEVVDAFYLIGYDRMESLGFKMHMIIKEGKKQMTMNGRFNPVMVKAIQAEFEKDKLPVLEVAIVPRLQPIYNQFDFKIKACANDLTFYFKTKRTTNKEGKKVLRLNGEINSI